MGFGAGPGAGRGGGGEAGSHFGGWDGGNVGGRFGGSTRARVRGVVRRFGRFDWNASAAGGTAVVAPFACGVWALGEGAGEVGGDRGDVVAVRGGSWLRSWWACWCSGCCRYGTGWSVVLVA